jgi:uncharacterized protein (TIGR03067 family)
MAILMRVVLLLGVVGLLSAAEANGKVDSAELKKLQGTWALVSGEMDGKPLPDEAVKKNKMTWKQGAIELDSPHQSKEPIKAQVTGLDSSKTPHEMTFKRSKGPSAGKDIKGIYVFDGADSFKVCFDPSGKARPKELATTPGSGYILHVWKRAK